MSLKVLLVDDNQEFIESATRFLTTDPQIEIVGRAFTGAQAMEQIAALQPDLVLMDVAMPEMNGFQATRLIKSQAESPRVIILTLHDLVEYRLATEAVRADGFVAKSNFGTDLIPLIQTLFPASKGKNDGVPTEG